MLGEARAAALRCTRPQQEQVAKKKELPTVKRTQACASKTFSPYTDSLLPSIRRPTTRRAAIARRFRGLQNRAIAARPTSKSSSVSRLLQSRRRPVASARRPEFLSSPLVHSIPPPPPPPNLGPDALLSILPCPALSSSFCPARDPSTWWQVDRCKPSHSAPSVLTRLLVGRIPKSVIIGSSSITHQLASSAWWPC